MSSIRIFGMFFHHWLRNLLKFRDKTTLSKSILGDFWPIALFVVYFCVLSFISTKYEYLSVKIDLMYAVSTLIIHHELHFRNFVLLNRTLGLICVSIQTEPLRGRSWYKLNVTRPKTIRISSVTWQLEVSKDEEPINAGLWVSDILIQLKQPRV